ncbi:MAG TPA: glutaredoxin family protein [Ktedonobacteraceae bacterium]|nr:glutaredoxin family protein [Ktedonobacteraceae bacterium]
MKQEATSVVTFYTKAGCHLCEDARELLEEIAENTEYTLTEIDIRSDPAVFELYRYRIPVIVINEKTLLEGRIEAEELALAFQQAKGV